MKFLVDAQLPYRLANYLNSQQQDVIHCRDLPNGNKTTDQEILEISIRENRTVITKDRDFQHSFLVIGKPHKLLLVSTGNISNNDLLSLFQTKIKPMINLLKEHSFVELQKDKIILHG